MTSEVSRKAAGELAVPDTLRVGINMGNSLLVTGTRPDSTPVGVAPDMAASLAERIGVPIDYRTYPTPGEVADAGEKGEWDICLIAAEPKRAEKIAFSKAYVEIEATYLVPEGSLFQSVADVDQPGVRIATMARAAYDLFLTRTLKHAKLVRIEGPVFETFVSEQMDALAGLAPGLQRDQKNLSGSRLLDGSFTSILQSIGTRPENSLLKSAVELFIDELIENGYVAELIERHGVKGKLRVAINV